MSRSHEAWKDIDFSQRYERKRGDSRGMDKGTITTLQAQLTTMTNLLESMALTNVNAAGGKIQTI